MIATPPIPETGDFRVRINAEELLYGLEHGLLSPMLLEKLVVSWLEDRIGPDRRVWSWNGRAFTEMRDQSAGIMAVLEAVVYTKAADNPRLKSGCFGDTPVVNLSFERDGDGRQDQ